MSDNLSNLLKRAKDVDDTVAFAKLLTAIERAGPKILKIEELLKPSRCAFRIGVTGPPGAGKSTLISHLLKHFAAKKMRIGVIAVDPTSPFTNGAILGDRIRYAAELQSEKIFVRSLGTRGSLGGLSASVYLMLRAFDACDFDVVIVETVGVGQVEVEVVNVADQIVLVLVPESGDSIQVMKAGVIEIADTVVINKSDRPGADALKREVEAHMKLIGDKSAAVISLSALDGSGVDELAREIDKYIESGVTAKERLDPKRLRAEALALRRSQLDAEATAWARHIGTVDSLKKAIIKIT